VYEKDKNDVLILDKKKEKAVSGIISETAFINWVSDGFLGVQIMALKNEKYYYESNKC